MRCRIPPIPPCRHAARRGRGGRRGAVRRRARHHHAPRVLLAAQARARRSRRCARSTPRVTVTRNRARSSRDDEGPFQAFPRPAATIITGDFNLEPDDPLHARMVGAVRRRHAAAGRRVGARHGARRAAADVLRARAVPANRKPFACDFVFVERRGRRARARRPRRRRHAGSPTTSRWSSRSTS